MEDCRSGLLKRHLIGARISASGIIARQYAPSTAEERSIIGETGSNGPREAVHIHFATRMGYMKKCKGKLMHPDWRKYRLKNIVEVKKAMMKNHVMLSAWRTNGTMTKESYDRQISETIV